MSALTIRSVRALFIRRKWEGGDPGVAHQKTPTCLLLTPKGAFHSFGYTARDHYHDLDPKEAREWLYFEKFKMKIHSATVSSIATAGSRTWPGPGSSRMSGLPGWAGLGVVDGALVGGATGKKGSWLGSGVDGAGLAWLWAGLGPQLAMQMLEVLEDGHPWEMGRFYERNVTASY